MGAGRGQGFLSRFPECLGGFQERQYVVIYGTWKVPKLLLGRDECLLLSSEGSLVLNVKESRQFVVHGPGFSLPFLSRAPTRIALFPPPPGRSFPDAMAPWKVPGLLEYRCHDGSKADALSLSLSHRCHLIISVPAKNKSLEI